MTLPAPRLGIVAGLDSEARIARNASGGSKDVQILAAGASSERAEACAHELVGRGVSALLSFGVAGGLDPEFRPGTLILADEVVALDGFRHRADVEAIERIARGLPPGMPVARGTILGIDGAVTSKEAKSDLFRRTAAVALDMESHRIARVAAETGTGFVVMRAVADPSSRSLPHAAQVALDEEGRIRVGRTLGALLRRPWEVVPLVRLAREHRAAMAMLRRVAPLACALVGHI